MIKEIKTLEDLDAYKLYLMGLRDVCMIYWYPVILELSSGKKVTSNILKSKLMFSIPREKNEISRLMKPTYKILAPSLTKMGIEFFTKEKVESIFLEVIEVKYKGLLKVLKEYGIIVRDENMRFSGKSTKTWKHLN